MTVVYTIMNNIISYEYKWQYQELLTEVVKEKEELEKK